MTKTRLYVLARLAKHGTSFERDMCGAAVGKALKASGHVMRFAGSARGGLTTLQLTAVGWAVARDLQCECWACCKARLAESKVTL